MEEKIVKLLQDRGAPRSKGPKSLVNTLNKDDLEIVDVYWDTLYYKLCIYQQYAIHRVFKKRIYFFSLNPENNLKGNLTSGIHPF